MNPSGALGEWLTSEESEKAFHVNSCELMHLRLAGNTFYEGQPVLSASNRALWWIKVIEPDFECIRENAEFVVGNASELCLDLR